DSDSWKIEGVTIPKGGQWKFRMNDDANWTANLGYGSLSDLVQDGNNIADTAPGVYTIELFIGATPYHATLTKTGDADAPALPETMYIIGNDFGSWNWDSESVVDMTPVNGKDGAFWAIRYLTADTEFKFCPVRAWNGDFCTLGTNEGFTTPGNNKVEKAGLYIICVDVAADRILVEPARVFGIGECFGGWESDPVAFTVDGAKVVSPALAAGELRMYTAASCYDAAWWQMEFIVLDGKIAYRGNGGDQERVSCTAGQKVTLDFNAGTGVIE
ncbi:MAG: SusF/SusE family outer membrane protein, partial [Bacteroidales bacterium]|nr:SusF/SusE family outer membrane protein [Bacteroidales bacterium]